MSSGSLAVRFPDGEVRWGIYNGTSDIAQPWLFRTCDEAWKHRGGGGRKWDEPYAASDVRDVDVFAFYGYGFWWKGRATKDLYLGPYGDSDDLDPNSTIVELGSCSTLDMDDAPDWVQSLL